MVTRSLSFVLIGFVFAVSTRADLNLSPKLAEFDGEGMTFQHLVFSDGTGKEITYRQPAGWRYAGSATKLTLHPPSKALAEGRISTVPLSQPQTFSGEAVKLLVQQALAAVPPGSTDAVIISQEKDAARIGGKETFLVVIAYRFYGEHLMSSLMFMNRGSEQIRFQLVSRAADFSDLQRAFLASQFTWYNL